MTPPFDDRSARLFLALADRIIPADDLPSATQAGAGEFLARLFAGDLAHLVQPVSEALAALDNEALHVFGAGFCELPESAQDELLMRVETGNVRSAWPCEPADFFDAAVRWVAEGFYGDPGNGGNRDGVSWAMIGFARTAIPQAGIAALPVSGTGAAPRHTGAPQA